MSRPMRGQDVLDDALQAIGSAKTIEQLRQAQALVLPLQYGMSLAQTAQAIGISTGWVCRLRNQFIRGQIVEDGSKPVRGGRHRENFTHEQEAELLKPFLEEAGKGGILVVGKIKPQLEAALGREMGLSTVYKRLHWHNWRNLHLINGTRKAPLKLKRTGKKTPRKTRGNSQRLGARRTDLPNVPRRGTLWAYQRRAPLLGSQTNTSFMSGHADSRIYLRLCCRRAAQWRT